jgi:hypothetical protein
MPIPRSKYMGTVLLFMYRRKDSHRYQRISCHVQQKSFRSFELLEPCLSVITTMVGQLRYFGHQLDILDRGEHLLAVIPSHYEEQRPGCTVRSSEA